MNPLVGGLGGNCYSEYLEHLEQNDVLVIGRQIQNDDVQRSV